MDIIVLLSQLDIIGIVTLVGVTISYITFHYQKKNQNMNALLEVYKILNDNEHRLARKKVYLIYHEYKEGMSNSYTINRNTNYIAIVNADFDQIGMLIQQRLVPKKIFLKQYGVTVINCWNALLPYIETERKDRNYRDYMENFQYLKEEAEKIVGDQVILYKPKDLIE